jgi:hypothetical protein
MDAVDCITGIEPGVAADAEPSEALPHAGRDAMYRQFEDSPGDFTAYLVLADMLDELGYAKLAYAFRWMGARRLCPHKRERYVAPGATAGKAVPMTFRWAWYREPSLDRLSDTFPRVSVLPHALAKQLLPARHCYYPSHQAAVMDLAKRLQRLKDVYTLEPRKVA